MTYSCMSPVVLVAFRRPEVTARVLAAIAAVRPPALYVVQDGPRASEPGDPAAIAATWDVIRAGITWPCRVSANRARTNLGLRARVSSGLDWVFAREDRAIILEDDTVPTVGFFRFSDELLDVYADDPQVGLVSGNNFQRGVLRGTGSYYFSRYAHIWGWATWRRAWSCFDADLSSWCAESGLAILRERFRGVEPIVRFWADAFTRVKNGQLDSWATAWNWQFFLRNWVSVIPQQNLVTNIGFGPDATHCLHEEWYSDLATGELAWPLVHPTQRAPVWEADLDSARSVFGIPIEDVPSNPDVAVAPDSLELLRRSAATMASGNRHAALALIAEVRTRAGEIPGLQHLQQRAEALPIR